MFHFMVVVSGTFKEVCAPDFCHEIECLGVGFIKVMP